MSGYISVAVPGPHLSNSGFRRCRVCDGSEFGPYDVGATVNIRDCRVTMRLDTRASPSGSTRNIDCSSRRDFISPIKFDGPPLSHSKWLFL